MNQDAINNLQALLDAGTQGEWRVFPPNAGVSDTENYLYYLYKLYVDSSTGKVATLTDAGHHHAEPVELANAALIVALKNSAPALLEAARELESAKSESLTLRAIVCDFVKFIDSCNEEDLLALDDDPHAPSWLNAMSDHAKVVLGKETA